MIVSGLSIRGADWEFRAHVLNRHNGTESIEVVGGRPGDRTLRSFEPGRIFALTGRNRAGSGRSGALSPVSRPWPRRPSCRWAERPRAATARSCCR